MMMREVCYMYVLRVVCSGVGGGATSVLGVGEGECVLLVCRCRGR